MFLLDGIHGLGAFYLTSLIFIWTFFFFFFFFFETPRAAVSVNKFIIDIYNQLKQWDLAKKTLYKVTF